MQSEIRNKSGDVLSTDTELIDVTSIFGGYIPDKDWQHTDNKGHVHFYSDTEDHYPTLKMRHWSYFCKQCGQTIEPGTKPDPKHPAGVTEYTAGPTYYYLNGNPITKEEAERILKSWQERGDVKG